MEERFLQQLKKGVLELLVLQTICRKPTYGYELIAQLGSRSGGLFTLREGTLYPILYRLEDDGLIGSGLAAGDRGVRLRGRSIPRRKRAEKKMNAVSASSRIPDGSRPFFAGRMQDMNENSLRAICALSGGGCRYRGK